MTLPDAFPHAVGFLLRLAGWVLLAPLVPGIVARVKAVVAGRRGPPLLQPWYDLARLWRKAVVLPERASAVFVAGPAVAWVATVSAAMLLPVAGAGAPLGFRGDVLAMLGLLALARAATATAALDAGSAFGGMGASREVSFSVLAEAASVTALLALATQAGSASLDAMLRASAGAATVLLGSGLFVVLLAENARVPFDDPATHLELTMVHEAMVLDHGGPPLAATLHAAAVKLSLYALLLAEAVLPVGDLEPLARAGAVAGGVVATAVGVGLVESLTARLAFRRVPLLLVTAFLCCLFALLVARAGGAR